MRANLAALLILIVCLSGVPVCMAAQHDGTPSFLTLDVCHSGGIAVAQSGEMPAIIETPLHVSDQGVILAIDNPVQPVFHSLFTSLDERPPQG